MIVMTPHASRAETIGGGDTFCVAAAPCTADHARDVAAHAQLPGKRLA